MQATQVARSDAGVLLTGESGTGKELLAAHIHRESPFAARPFVKVNCAAIPTELIESELFGHEKGRVHRRGRRCGAASSSWPTAARIFLDEVGDLHEASQAKLLRVLQDGEFQRLGGEQTHSRHGPRDLRDQSRSRDAGRRRAGSGEDLYYRLSVVPIRVPALRERLQDVGELAAYFLAEFCARNNFRRKAMDDEVVPVLERYNWPGNVRELRNAIERMAILTPGRSHHRRSRSRWRSGRRSAARPSGLHEIRDSAERERIRQGAGAGQLERLERGARARHRAHEPPQAPAGARPQSRRRLIVE